MVLWGEKLRGIVFCWVVDSRDGVLLLVWGIKTFEFRFEFLVWNSGFYIVCGFVSAYSFACTTSIL